MADDDAILRATQQQLQDAVNTFSASSDRISRTMRDSTNGLSTQFYRLSSTSNLTSSYVEHLGKTAAVAGGITGDLAKEFAQIDYAVGVFASSLEEASGAIINSKKKVDKDDDDSGAPEIKKASGGLLGSISLFTNAFSGGASMLGSVSGLISGIRSPLTLLAGALGAGTEVVMDNYNGWREATKAGALFTADITEYGNQVVETRLSTGQFNKILGSASNSLSLIGGTVGAGVEQFSRLAGAMRSTEVYLDGSSRSVVEQMAMLGISAEESGELVGSFLSRQSMAATISSMSQQELAEATGKYMSELTQLSQLTGKSRKELADEIAAKEKDAQFRAMLAGLDEDQRKGIGQTLTMMKNLYGPEAEEVIQAAFAGVPVQSEKAMTLQASEMGQILSQIGMEMRDQARAGGDPGEAFSNNVGRLNEASDEFAESIRGLALTGVEGYDDLYVKVADANTRFAELMEQARTDTGNEMITAAEALAHVLQVDAGKITKEGAQKGADALTSAIAEVGVIGADMKAALRKGAQGTADALGEVVIAEARAGLGQLVNVGFGNEAKELNEAMGSTIPVVNSATEMWQGVKRFFSDMLLEESLIGASGTVAENYEKTLSELNNGNTANTLTGMGIKLETTSPGIKPNEVITAEVTGEELARQIITKLANDPADIMGSPAKRDEFMKALIAGKDTEADLIKNSMEDNLKKDGKSLAALLYELLTEQKTGNTKLYDAVMVGNSIQGTQKNTGRMKTGENYFGAAP